MMNDLSPSLKKISSLINLNTLKKPIGRQTTPSPLHEETDTSTTSATSPVTATTNTTYQHKNGDENVLHQLISIQDLLLEEQLLLTQEKQSVMNTLHSINSLKLNIPLLLLNIRQYNQKLTQISLTEIQEEKDSSRPSRSPAPKAINKVLSRWTASYVQNNQQQQQQTQQPISVNRASMVDDLKNRRLYKLNDKDHPLTVMKLNYEMLVTYIRLEPIIFAKACRGIVKSQQMSKQNNSEDRSESKRISDKLVDLLIYALYGNHSNPLESKCILKYIKTILQMAFEMCQKPSDILKNHFIKELLVQYMRREGLEFFKYLHVEALFELLQNDDFDVRIEHTKPAEPLPEPRKSQENLVSSIMSALGSSPTATSNIDAFDNPRSIDQEGIAKTAEELLKQDYERKIRQNKINLYNVCTKIISTLSANIESIPYTIRSVLKCLFKCAQNRFSMAKAEQKAKMLKVVFFQYFLIPGILDPQRVGACEFIVLPTLRNKLQTITHVLKYLAQEKEFEATSPFRGMNVVIDQNRQAVDKIMAQIIDTTGNSSTMMSLLQRISSTFSSSNVSKSLEKTKEGLELSPICISTEDLKMVMQILVQSSFSKQEHVPNNIKEALSDILNWHTNPLSSLAEKFMIMNMHESSIHDLLPDETPYLKSAKSDSIKYLIQQVLISVKRIEPRLIGKNKSHTFDSILDALYLREKIAGRMIAATTIQELKYRYKQSTMQSSRVFSELSDDIASRRQYIYDIMDAHKNLLIDFDTQQNFVQSLTTEKDKFTSMLASTKILPFFQSVYLADFMRDFRKCAFVEDQEKKLRNQYFKLKNDMTQYAQRNFIPQAELEQANLQLMRLLLRKVYRLLVSPKGSPFEKNDEIIAKKMKHLGSAIQPIHLEIPTKYHSVCNSAFAREELLKLDMYVLPRDKISCITKCSSILIELMRLSGDEAPGIDNFLPILIYNLTLANPPRLYSNLKYINRFDDLFLEPSALPIFSEFRDYTGEYWLRHFEAAVLFLEGLDADSLLESQKVPEDDSNRANADVEIQFLRSRSRPVLEINTTPDITITTPISSPIHHKEKSESMDTKVLSDDRRASLTLPSPKRFHFQVPSEMMDFQFMNVNVDDLKYSDIPRLLSEYNYAVQQLQKLLPFFPGKTEEEEEKIKGDTTQDLPSSSNCQDMTVLDLDPYTFRTDHTDDLISDDEDDSESPQNSTPSSSPGTPTHFRRHSTVGLTNPPHGALSPLERRRSASTIAENKSA